MVRLGVAIPTLIAARETDDFFFLNLLEPTPKLEALLKVLIETSIEMELVPKEPRVHLRPPKT